MIAAWLFLEKLQLSDGSNSTRLARGIVVQLLRLHYCFEYWNFTICGPQYWQWKPQSFTTFIWHWRWTWADRRSDGLNHMAATLLRFNFSNGMISLFGTVLCTGILTGIFRLNPLLANVLSLGPCCVINYLVSDRLIFMSLNTGESA